MRSLTDRRFLMALVLLIANDRFAKGEWPGLITGKISDFAGPIVAAVLAAVVIEAVAKPEDRRRTLAISIGAVSVLMVAIKTSSLAAGFVESALAITGASQAIVVDPTDLVGLVGLAAVPGIIASPTPLVRSAFFNSAPIKTIALGVAAFACLATSEIDNPTYDAVSVGGDRIVVLDQTQQDSAYLISEDRGQTWSYEYSSEELVLPGPLVAEASLCLRNNQSVCIRSVPGLSVEESRDGGETWRNVYEIEPGGHLASFTNGETADLSQEASAMTELDDGSVVVVMGQLDPAVRNPDGVWGPDVGRYRTPGVAAIFGIVLGTAVLAAAAVLIGIRRQALGVVLTLGTLPPLLLTWSSWFVNDGLGLFLLPSLLGIGVVVIGAPVLYVIGVLTRNKKHPFKPATLALLFSPILVGLVPLVPLIAWRIDLTSSVVTGWFVFLFAIAVAVAVGLFTSSVDGPPPQPGPPRVPPAPTWTSEVGG